MPTSFGTPLFSYRTISGVVGIKTKLSGSQAPARQVQLTQYLTNEELGVMGFPSVREGGKLPKRQDQVFDTKLI